MKTFLKLSLAVCTLFCLAVIVALAPLAPTYPLKNRAGVWLYEQGRIDTAVIVAPKGVYRNWETSEIPTHFPTDIPHDITSFIWKNPAMREKQLARYFHEVFGIDAMLVRQAIEIADGADAAFRQSLAKRAETVIQQVSAANEFAVVMSMRPYQNDPLVNHHIGKYFTRLGVPVIPAEALPGIDDVPLDDGESGPG